MSSPGPSLPKSNALQGRIASVLAASYADLEIRDSLQTLDARHVRNTAETRRNLRLEVQQELIECNGDIVQDFGRVAEQLKRVGTVIAELNKSCAAIRSHVAAANRETKPVLDESSAMTTQKMQAETKEKLLNAFTTHFLLSDAELSALTSTAEPVTDDFFQALSRTKKVHHDSQVLLGSEDQHLGLEILEHSSKQLNAAFQKLFRWTQREIRTLDLENPQLSGSVRRALRVLAERPALFQGCLDFFAESREHVLSDAFYSALTGVTTTGNAPSSVPSRAIELNAHDPLRYVSDMLAWAHAATVGEREALQMLFIGEGDEISKSMKAGREAQPWLHFDAADGSDTEATFDGKKALNDLVDRDLSGVVRQLKQRIEQIVHSHEDASLAYQISNLVTFYCSIFASLLGEDSSIEQALLPTTNMAMEQFRSTTRDHIANLHSDVTVAPADFSPPDFLEEALQSLKGLMKSYDTSFTNVASLAERTAGFQAVLSEALDPYLGGCESMAKRLSPPDSQIFSINCLTATKDSIKGASYTTDRVQLIDDNIEEQKARLTQAVHYWFVAESGMQTLLETLEPFADSDIATEVQKIARLDVLQAEALAEIAHQLDTFLPTAVEDARAFIGNLDDKTTMRDVCEQAADLFIGDFEMVEALLAAVDEAQITDRHGPNGDVEEDEQPMLRDVYPRTSDEIKVLLS